MSTFEQRLIMPDHPRTWEKLPSPPAKNLWCIYADDQMPAKYQNSRPSEAQGYPMTVSLFSDSGRVAIKMDPRFQKFFLSINPGLAPNAWGSLIDTYSNLGNRVRDSRDYINNRNLSAPEPSFPFLLTFGMSVVNVIQENLTWMGGFGIPVGEIVHEIEALSIDLFSTTLNYFGNEHLVVPQVLGLTKIINGRNQRNPYIQNGGRSGIPTFTPRVKPALSRLYIVAGKTFKVSAPQNNYNPDYSWEQNYLERTK